MGKIGKYEYPQHDIEECADIIETVDEYEITKQELLATKLGHENPDSGAFRNKITSLRRYGLISGRGGVTLTSVAERIANPAPNTNDKRKAMGEAADNVALLSRLFDRLDGEPPDDDFWYHLAELTEVDRSEAKEKAGRLQRLYSTALPYLSELKSQDEEPTEKASIPEDESFSSGPMTDNVDASMKTRDFGEIKIRDKDTLELARNMLDLLEKKYEQEQG